MTEPDSRVSQMQHRSREISSMLCLTFQLDQNHGFCRLSHSEELQTKLIVLTRPSDQRSLRKSTGPQAMGCVKLFEASATASSLPRLPLRPARVEWFRPPGPTQKTRTQASRFHTHTHAGFGLLLAVHAHARQLLLVPLPGNPAGPYKALVAHSCGSADLPVPAVMHSASGSSASKARRAAASSAHPATWLAFHTESC